MTEIPENQEKREGWDDPAPDEDRQASSFAWLRNSCGTAADRRNQYILVGWMFAWMFVYTLAAQTLKGNLAGIGLEVEGATAWLVALLPNALAVVVLFAYLRFLRETDELTRLIQLQAFSIGFGVWVFMSLGRELFEYAGAAPLADDWQLMIPILAMVLGQLVSAWRYR